MTILAYIKRYLPVFVGILILWGGLFFYAAILNKSNQDVNKLVSKNANFMLQLNLKEFIKSSSYSLIFNSKDQGLLNAFQNFLNKQRKGKGKSNNFGIDFTQDITIYGEKYKEGEIYVMLLNLSDESKFLKNFPYYLGKNQAYKTIKGIGVITSYFGKDKIKTSEITDFCDNIQFSKHKKTKEIASKNFFQFDFNNYKLNRNFIIDKGTMNGFVTENELRFEGKLSTLKGNKLDSQWSLIPEGFYIQNSIISSTIQDSVQSLMSKIGISLPKIEQFTINYHGIEIQETNRGIIFTPIFDLLLDFKDIYSRKYMFQSDESLNELGFTREGNTILAGKVIYFIDSLSPTTLFIGNNLNSVVHRKNKTIFQASGDLNKLTEIKGSGFIVSFINLLPQFKASKQLVNKIQKIDIKTISQNGKVSIKGNIGFKKDVFLYNEVMKFYLILKGEY